MIVDPEAIGRVFEAGGAQHYLIVMDRSPKGLRFIDLLADAPAEMRARFDSEPFRAWQALAPYPLVVLFGTLGKSGGLTIPTPDLQTLDTQALPAAFERLEQRGGACACFVATADAIADEVAAMLTKLQPTAGPTQ